MEKIIDLQEYKKEKEYNKKLIEEYGEEMVQAYMDYYKSVKE
jgi:hypothetical protein